MPLLKYLSRLVILSFLIGSIAGCSKDNDNGAIPSANNQAVGASARDLLSSNNYSSLKIEIQYMHGYQPDASSVANLAAFLNSLINKPGGISVVQSEIASTGTPASSANDIIGIENSNRTIFNSGTQLGVYILVTDNAYTDANVIGLAYRNTSMVLFGKTLHDNSGGIGQASRIKLESTVAEHEFGHLLGLVNLGTSMQNDHEDGGHAKHCNNSNCLMYYTANTTDILGLLITGAIPVLDANCKTDLTANGGL